MAKRGQSKYKGRKGNTGRSGLSRVARTVNKSTNREGNLAKHADDEEFLESQGELRKLSHTGEGLLAKFNRLARQADDLDGKDGTVCGFDGTSIIVRDNSNDDEFLCILRNRIKKLSHGVSNPVCVGDRVRYQANESGDKTDYVIVALLPRNNQLYRTDSHNRSLIHVFASNIDRLIIVSSSKDPDLKPSLIDRYLLIAHCNDIEPVVVLNKYDLRSCDKEQELYHSLGYTCIGTSIINNQGIDELRATLKGQSCVFAGQSGVGKSSLINALYPDCEARIGDVSNIQHKGKHTTTSSKSYLLPDGGALVDTPGIRECGIPNLDPVSVGLLYRDIAQFQPNCKFNDCTHQHEPQCAVREAVERGDIAQSRYESYLRILEDDLQ